MNKAELIQKKLAVVTGQIKRVQAGEHSSFSANNLMILPSLKRLKAKLEKGEDC